MHVEHPRLEETGQLVAIVLVDHSTSSRHDVQIPKKPCSTVEEWSMVHVFPKPSNLICFSSQQQENMCWAWKVIHLRLTANYSFCLLQQLAVSKTRKCNVLDKKCLGYTVSNVCTNMYILGSSPRHFSQLLNVVFGKVYRKQAVHRARLKLRDEATHRDTHTHTPLHQMSECTRIIECILATAYLYRS